MLTRYLSQKKFIRFHIKIEKRNRSDFSNYYFWVFLNGRCHYISDQVHIPLYTVFELFQQIYYAYLDFKR